MFGQMESWDATEQCIIVIIVVQSFQSFVFFVSRPHFWKFKGLALLYFAGVLTLCFTLKRKTNVTQERPMSHRSLFE